MDNKNTEDYIFVTQPMTPATSGIYKQLPPATEFTNNTLLQFSYCATLLNSVRVYPSLKEAKRLPDCTDWKVAHEKEFNAIEAQGTYVLVKIPRNNHIPHYHELSISRPIILGML
jgi:hypothetical protein